MRTCRSCGYTSESGTHECKGFKFKEDTYITRLKDEYSELADKHTKLVDFLIKDREPKLGKVHLELLQKQEKIMSEYLSILAERLKNV
jgi:hypothetical protein